jgi:hypothetical protein
MSGLFARCATRKRWRWDYNPLRIDMRMSRRLCDGIYMARYLCRGVVD